MILNLIGKSKRDYLQTTNVRSLPNFKFKMSFLDNKEGSITKCVPILTPIKRIFRDSLKLYLRDFQNRIVTVCVSKAG